MNDNMDSRPNNDKKNNMNLTQNVDIAEVKEVLDVILDSDSYVVITYKNKKDDPGFDMLWSDEISRGTLLDVGRAIHLREIEKDGEVSE